jgi:hypothetical protein
MKDEASATIADFPSDGKGDWQRIQRFLAWPEAGWMAMRIPARPETAGHSRFAWYPCTGGDAYARR